jgi:hypothetical protein
MKPDWEFIVRFKSHDADMEAMHAMGRIDKVFFDDRGDSYINRRQLEELNRLRIPYKIVHAPLGYKATVAKTLRK